MKSGPPSELLAPALDSAFPDDAHALVSAGSLGDRFAAMAARYPDKTAIRFQSGDLTYRELNTRANRLAHALRRDLPASPTRVALLFHQGPRPLTALLGVLKAGHAFVPLDATDPAARLQTILQDCQPGAIVTDDEHAALAGRLGGDRIPVLNLECLPMDLPGDNPEHSVPPDALAYIFYTSGSTGQPKGVCQIHRNVLHYIGCYCDTLRVSHEDRFSLLYTLSFSASNMDVFGSLLHGATLCPYNIRQRGIAELADWLDEEGITLLHAVPTVYRHLLQNLPSSRRFPSVRAVDLGGEPVYPSDIALHRRHFEDHSVLVNHLAATEFCVIAQYPVDPRTHDPEGTLPVGRPPAGSIIRILREDGSQAAVGETGEVVVHSPYLSPGYWRRPDLNGNVFGKDPERPGWLTYSSGDLGFFNADGDLQFLGRKDFRVKIRGISVDTSEVEAALRECAWIRDAAVTTREDETGESSRRLVAFLEIDPDRDPARNLVELRAYLQQRLPGYMVPAEFGFLESLPRTTTGKLDRKALAQFDIPAVPAAVGDDDSDRAEDDDIARAVRQRFQDILRQPRVHDDDDFFVLGGDSLKATQLHLELEGVLGRRIPLEKLFLKPTVAGIAGFLRKTRHSAAAGDTTEHSLVVPLRETGDKPKLFLTHGAKGQAFVSPYFLEIIGDDQPVYAYQAMGLDRTVLPEITVEGMAAQYVRALRAIQPRGPYFLGSICVGGVVTLEMAHQLTEAGEAVGPLLLIDPPVVPPGHRHWWKRFKRATRARLKKKRFRASARHKLVRNLREKKRKGTNFIDVDNAEVMTKAAHTAYDFELGLLRHRVKPYRGPVLILRSAERQAKQNRRGYRSETLQYPLRGDVRIWEVEGQHDQLLDVNNEEFARQLRDCMDHAWKSLDALRAP